MAPKKLTRPELDVSFTIPPHLIKEFREELRIVIRHPWIVGYPIPHRFLSDRLKEIYKGHEIFAVPPEIMK